MERDSHSAAESEVESETSTQSSRTFVVKKNDLNPNTIDKDVLINPYIEDNSREESYILTLGKNFFVHENTVPAINPESKKVNRNYWGVPKKASVMGASECKAHGLDTEKRYIKLPSGKSILCHTGEFIGITSGMKIIFDPIPKLITSLVDVKICKGGHYFDRCVVSVKNNSESCVYLRESSPIAEATFIRTSPADPKKGFGKDKEALTQIENDWKPENLFHIK